MRYAFAISLFAHTLHIQVKMWREQKIEQSVREIICSMRTDLFQHSLYVGKENFIAQQMFTK
jgi:hypothetical protein